MKWLECHLEFATRYPDARLFDRIRRMQARFDSLYQRIEAGFANTPELEGMDEIAAFVADERHQIVSLRNANDVPAGSMMTTIIPDNPQKESP